MIKYKIRFFKWIDGRHIKQETKKIEVENTTDAILLAKFYMKDSYDSYTLEIKNKKGH